MEKIGYVRISTDDQNVARQLDAMKEIGIEERNLFFDKQSGKDFNRPEYTIMKRFLRADDILYIHSLDRFGRNKDEIIKEWREITTIIGADVVVLDMPILDTTRFKDTGVSGIDNLITDIVLTVLAWVAEDEHKRIRTRQREGIESAKKAGKHLGRPQNVDLERFKPVYQQVKNGKMSAVVAMRKLGISKTTYYRFAKQIGESIAQ